MNSLFVDLMKKLANDTVVIYGFVVGDRGDALLAVLRKNGVYPTYFADTFRYGEQISGKIVLSPSQLLKLDNNEKVSVIITSARAHEIYRSLIENGLSGNIFVFYNHYLDDDWNILNDVEVHELIDKTKKINNELSDETSKIILGYLVDNKINYSADGLIKAFDMSVTSTGERQYFSKEAINCIAKRKDAVFVDCGAYDGDTVQCIYDLGIQFKRIYCFEPDSHNVLRLKDRVLHLEMEEYVYIVESGVWSETCNLYINETGNDSSMITTDNSGTKVHVVSIDDYFINLKIDMIKMDIEGCEMDALTGAMKTIYRDRPILAICIYHKFYDLTEIPLFLMDRLKSLRYEFMIRHYSGATETVLYCLPID